MTPFDVAQRTREEWVVAPTAKEKIILIVEYISYVAVCLAVGITLSLVREMIIEYATKKYVYEKEQRKE